jgi:hypothetical protein
MRCKWAKLLLSHYIEQGLDLKRREGLALHLQKCPACQKEMDRMSATVQIIQSIEDVDPPRDYVEAVRVRLEKG